MRIKQKKSNGDVSVPLCEGSIVHRELMGDHYILLVFRTAEPLHFFLGDYCDTDYGRFELVDLYEPEADTENGGYKYQLRLDAYYMKWKHRMMTFFSTDNSSSINFSLTRDLAGQMDLLLDNLKRLGEKDSCFLYSDNAEFQYVIDYDYVDKKSCLVKYSGTSIFDALNRYAEQWECEWWVVDNVIHFGRCEGNFSKGTLELNVNVAEMSRAQGSKRYINRLYAFGSTRNIPSDYRVNEAAFSSNGVIERRLMLPKGTPYIQLDESISESEIVEGCWVSEDVYPRTTCKIGANGISTYNSQPTQDGVTTTETFYRVSDTSGFIDNLSNDVILENGLRIIFQSGKLNGMEFECNLVENDSRIGKCFEIVANEDYGIKLPKADFCPAEKDEYIIIGWDSTKIADTNLITKAEEELKTKAMKYLKKLQVDPSEYTCTMISKEMQELGMPTGFAEAEEK